MVNWGVGSGDGARETFLFEHNVPEHGVTANAQCLIKATFYHILSFTDEIY